MQRRFLSLAFATPATLAALVALAPVACSGQSEGQRCSTLDDNGGKTLPGSDDCAGALLCYAAGTLGGAAAQYASEQLDPSLGICCPSNRTQATTSICANQPSPPGGNAAPPSDAGATGDAPESDAASDSSADAPVDGSAG